MGCTNEESGWASKGRWGSARGTRETCSRLPREAQSRLDAAPRPLVRRGKQPWAPRPGAGGARKTFPPRDIWASAPRGEPFTISATSLLCRFLEFWSINQLLDTHLPTARCVLCAEVLGCNLGKVRSGPPRASWLPAYPVHTRALTKSPRCVFNTRYVPGSGRLRRDNLWHPGAVVVVVVVVGVICIRHGEGVWQLWAHFYVGTPYLHLNDLVDRRIFSVH